MKTYTESQKNLLRTKVFSAFANGTPTQVKAYLKENAVLRLQLIDSGITETNVHKIKSHNSHQASVDEIVEIPQLDGTCLYKIEMKEEFSF